ncbi:MAG: hypothetical protein ABIH68_03065 [bacterium]
MGSPEKEIRILRKKLEELRRSQAGVRKLLGVRESVVFDGGNDEAGLIDDFQKIIHMNGLLKDGILQEKLRMHKGFAATVKQIQDSKRELEKSLKECREVIKKGERLQEEKESLEKEISDFRPREQEIKTLKLGLSARERELLKEFQDKESYLKRRESEFAAETARLREKLREREEEIEMLRKDLSRHLSQLAEMERLRKEELNAKTEQFRSEIESSEKMLHEEKNIREEMLAAKENEIKNIKKEADEITSRADERLNGFKKTREQRIVEIRELESRLAQSTRELESSGDRIEVLEADISRLREELTDEREGRKREAGDIRTALNQEIAGVEKILEERKQAEKGREDEWSRLLNEKEEKISALNDSMRSAVAAAEEKIKSLKKVLDAQKRESEEKSSSADALEKQAAGMKQEMESAEKRIKTAESEAGRLGRDLNDAVRAAKEREEAFVRKLADEAKKICDMKDYLGRQEASWKERTDRLSAGLAEIQKEKSSLEKKLKDTENESSAERKKWGEKIEEIKKRAEQEKKMPGGKLRDETSVRRFRCGSCHTEVPLAAKYCPNCGGRFRE